jgi:hypothetical protein
MSARDELSRGHRGLAIGLITLGTGLLANSLLGPLIGGVIRYRFSETPVNQGIGLDAASLGLVAPLSIGAGILALRGHPAAPVLALGPAVYAAYMSVQYAVGPEYLVLPGNNERFFPFHLGLFILATVIAVRAWATIDREALPSMSRRATRWFGGILLVLGALLFLRYLPGLIDLMGGQPSVPEYLENPTTFFLIALMDLGVFLPAAVGAGIAQGRGDLGKEGPVWHRGVVRAGGRGGRRDGDHHAGQRRSGRLCRPDGDVRRRRCRVRGLGPADPLAAVRPRTGRGVGRPPSLRMIWATGNSTSGRDSV